uniref:Uncharacterized protein n=1 Tax=Triticum urartu TaxID=4572 RepID=A0A8R7V9M5_TRIUA
MLSLGGWRMSNCQKARRNSAGPSVKMEAEHFLSRFSLLSTHACRWMTLLTVEGNIRFGRSALVFSPFQTWHH